MIAWNFLGSGWLLLSSPPWSWCPRAETPYGGFSHGRAPSAPTPSSPDRAGSRPAQARSTRSNRPNRSNRFIRRSGSRKSGPRLISFQPEAVESPERFFWNRLVPESTRRANVVKGHCKGSLLLTNCTSTIPAIKVSELNIHAN